MRSAITAAGLRKAYGDHLVLDGVDLDVAEGTIFALLGPNGAGKTTIVQILSTLIGANSQPANRLLDAPSVLVFRQPQELYVRINGYIDADTIAQAAENAAPTATVQSGSTALTSAWVKGANALCMKLQLELGHGPVVRGAVGEEHEVAHALERQAPRGKAREARHVLAAQRPRHVGVEQHRDLERAGPSAPPRTARAPCRMPPSPSCGPPDRGRDRLRCGRWS